MASKILEPAKEPVIERPLYKLAETKGTKIQHNDQQSQPTAAAAMGCAVFEHTRGRVTSFPVRAILRKHLFQVNAQSVFFAE